MKTLIADSGSTKTIWCLVSDNTVHYLHTQGINPYHQSPEQIDLIISQEVTPYFSQTDSIQLHFYGSGCTAEKAGIIRTCLANRFPHSIIEVQSDLLGAARALCKQNEGIAAILGTGSNSCLYDGKNIVANTPPLGYILGDEGSGAVLGRNLVANLLKGKLSQSLKEEFLNCYSLTQTDIIEQVYRKPMANRFLANFTPFLAENRGSTEVHQLLVEAFISFFERNIFAYQRNELPVHFVGSIAYYFSPELKLAASQCGFTVGQIVQNPIEKLCEYHQHSV